MTDSESPGLGDVSQDAVVVVPGIMGSALRDTCTGKQLWGIAESGWYVRALAPAGPGLTPLHLTAAERAGVDLLGSHPEALLSQFGELQRHFSRVTPNQLLRFPAFLPDLAGVEPYTALLKMLHAPDISPVASLAAVLEFPYDWRLPIHYNARLLAFAAARHLTRWRATEAPDRARRSRAHRDDRPAGLVLVTHSMGGLLARALALAEVIEGTGLDAQDIRTTITMGTPFYGSVKSAVMLGTGRGAPIPLPHNRSRALAQTLPGVHDLLPTYRCVADADGVHKLTTAEVAAFGGDTTLFEMAGAFHARLDKVSPIGHRSVVGTGQPTLATLRVDGDDIEGSAAIEDSPGRMRGTDGDGTVWEDAAALSPTPEYCVQQHGALARDPDVIARVRSIILEPDSGRRPPLGEGGIGIDAPDVAATDTRCWFTLTGIDNATAATAEIHLLTDGQEQPLDTPRLEPDRDALRGSFTPPTAGIYRLNAYGSRAFPVTRLILGFDPDADR
ncbi:hypothetical protein AB0E01_41390 [Nocardia vinacea]|uniref:lipase/acyltransferase domain-containing protein n=1 Tax=Nocardia vinacea TaxID=96468 RepID=UPI0033F787CE